MSKLGRTGYEAYARHAEHKSLISGEPLPLWPELPEPIRQAWDAAADAIADEACDHG